MRKIILLMHVSLDGFVAGPNGEMDWIGIGDDLWNYVEKVTDRCDTALYGAVTYKMMEDYWPTAAQQPDASEHDIKHSVWANSVKKYAFSTKDLVVSWQNTEVLHSVDPEQIRKMKEEPGKDILMLGSPTLAHSFMELGLIDEFYLNINSVVIGKGLPLFRDVTKKIELALVSEEKLNDRVVGLHYVLRK